MPGSITGIQQDGGNLSNDRASVLNNLFKGLTFDALVSAARGQHFRDDGRGTRQQRRYCRRRTARDSTSNAYGCLHPRPAHRRWKLSWALHHEVVLSHSRRRDRRPRHRCCRERKARGERTPASMGQTPATAAGNFWTRRRRLTGADGGGDAGAHRRSSARERPPTADEYRGRHACSTRRTTGGLASHQRGELPSADASTFSTPLRKVERNIFRAAGEDDDHYRERVGQIADTVSPYWHICAINRIPAGRLLVWFTRLPRGGGRASLPKPYWDLDPYDNDFTARISGPLPLLALSYATCAPFLHRYAFYQLNPEMKPRVLDGLRRQA